MKRIVICADGTWNRPGKGPEDQPTNVLKLARAVKPAASDGVAQQVFYYWGLGSYHDGAVAGTTGRGIGRNTLDNYRYLVHNYAPGDEIYLLGFSRGSYKVRSLCGLINNCGILKRPDARLIQSAFEYYKKSGPAHSPNGVKSKDFRATHSYPNRTIKFVGVWDTVGALSIPFSFLGFLDNADEFYHTKMGDNILTARHAMAIDELRSDFEPTIWHDREHMSLNQVWFNGVHSNIGGSYPADLDGGVLSDISMDWIRKEAKIAGLHLETHMIQGLKPVPKTTLHQSRKHIFRSKRPFYRPIDHGRGEVLMHRSVKQRWEADANYRQKIWSNIWRTTMASGPCLSVRTAGLR
jgi:uncharacterized protein (DUF2235 family)